MSIKYRLIACAADFVSRRNKVYCKMNDARCLTLPGVAFFWARMEPPYLYALAGPVVLCLHTEVVHGHMDDVVGKMDLVVSCLLIVSIADHGKVRSLDSLTLPRLVFSHG